MLLGVASGPVARVVWSRSDYAAISRPNMRVLVCRCAPVSRALHAQTVRFNYDKAERTALCQYVVMARQLMAWLRADAATLRPFVLRYIHDEVGGGWRPQPRGRGAPCVLGVSVVLPT